MEAERRLYTIAELAEASAAALDALGIATRNGQVRDRPDVRTIRYYSTLGLLDRPTEMTGRTARYGDRHLLQVLAVKALQARGVSLADVQRRLVGASEPELRAVVGPDLPAALSPVTGTPRPPGRAFWRTPPGAAPATAFPAGESGTAAAGPADPDVRPLRAAPAVAAPRARARMLASPAQPSPAPAAGLARADGPMRPRQLIAVPLAAGATLLIEHADGDAVDVEALRAAAAPLLAHLTDAGLVPGSPTRPGATP
jgi:DNA-binding transcriptional MerR regulator